MSTNKTEHYQLHQWEPSDPVSLAEVNENFSALDAAVAEVLAAAEALPYVAGKYTGTSKSGNKITLGFRPSFVIIGYPYGPSDSALSIDAVVAFGAEGRSKVISMEDDGFTLLITTQYPRINYSGYSHVYIAFP